MTRPQSLFVLVAVMLVTMTGFGIFLPIFPFLALTTGAGAAAITWAMGAYSLGQFIAAPFWGRLSDRIGRKPILIGGLIATALSYLMLARADTVLEISAARLFCGLMAGNAGAAFAAAADLADEKTSARNMGLLGAAIGVGFIAGPAIGAMLVGAEPDTGDFRRICEVAAGFAACAALVALAFFRETRDTGAPAAAPRPWSLLMSRRALTIYIAVTLLMTVALALMESTLGLWSHVAFRWGPREVGWALAAMGLGVALVQGGGAGVAARALGDERVAVLGLGAFALGFALLANAQAPWVAFVALGAISLGAGLATPAVQSLVAAQADESERGAIMGLGQSASALGRVMGPAIAGLIFASMGHSAPYWLAAAILGLATVLAGLKRRGAAQ